MAIVIGLTGSIATGKSTIAQLFIEAHIPVVDADQIAREIVEPGKKAYYDIITTFGDKILVADGTINRKQLAKLIFNNQESRAALNEIVHPIIFDELKMRKEQLVKKHHPIVVLDIPLLFESKLTHLVDCVVVAYTTPDNQLARLMARDQIDEQAARKRINAQLSIDQKKAWADYIIDNNGTKLATKKQFDLLLALLLP
ncbi:dephospho-CoA kinase [Amphibacillus marinus]|uniref:Dephospho-CoA kinase n=1 Tax=Amphibacillus marinus TaxID=872970 RepID=A0A1H8SUQ4_9BACI|nr:dephospho-CoA kinase [Amphibacillus marinus]SEO82275.1 dephospho-CoA kinase [Amphibacillus marinus]